MNAFEKNYLEPLNGATGAKDFKRFDEALKDGIQGCNTCHVGQEFPCIKYQLPKAPISPFSMKP